MKENPAWTSMIIPKFSTAKEPPKYLNVYYGSTFYESRNHAMPPASPLFYIVDIPYQNSVVSVTPRTTTDWQPGP